MRFLDHYLWSSFRSYSGEPRYDTFVHTTFVLGMMRTDRRTAVRAYRRCVREGVLREMPNPLALRRGQVVLGSPSFTERIYRDFIDAKQGEKEYADLKASIPDISMGRIVACVSKEFGLEPAVIARRRPKNALARKVLVELCCQFLIKDKSLSEIARELGGVSVSSLCKSRKELGMLIGKSAYLKKKFDRIRARLLSS